jgi:hypothetical protein
MRCGSDQESGLIMLFISQVTEIDVSLLRKVKSGRGYPPSYFIDITIRNKEGERTTISASMAEEAGEAIYQQQGDELEKAI